jgi:hypothetical protein
MTSSERKWQNNLLLFTVVVNPDSAASICHAELNLFTLQILFVCKQQRFGQKISPKV